MKTLTSSAVYDAHDPVAFRVKVIEHARDYGWKAAVSAFGIGKSTLYDWKKRYHAGRQHIRFLIPQSTRPKTLRAMHTHPAILAFIKSVRMGEHPMNKYTIKPLLDAYCIHLGIVSVGATTIGKLIHRNHWFQPRKVKRLDKRRFRGQRRRYAPRTTIPGHIEMDSILLYILGKRWQFMSVIDVATRYGYCSVVASISSMEARRVLLEFQERFPYPVTTMQTDNGSEFLGVFHDRCLSHGITHEFIYPRSPKINGMVERFNRTVQEECIERADEVFYDPERFKKKLADYMTWYNTKRPHMSLHLQTPIQVLQQFTSSIPESM
ncbi:MAG: integrase core domain-containing protein [Candidatus Kaiserbacteria bacterium]|nr:integrase core domain-containing protein [Candidatus Kaiserbacteria bacterium]